MQVSWIEHDKSNLLSLGNPKTLSFPGDTGVGGGPQVSWKASDPVITQAASNDSSSSAMISQSNGPPQEKVSCENSDQSGSILKEHDYMGMADISSAPPLKAQLDTDDSQELNLRETHLCLGLGLGLAPSANAESVKDTGKTITFTFSQQETKTLVDPSNNSAKYAFIDGTAGQQSAQTSWPSAAAVRTITVENSIPSDSQGPHICLPVQEFGSSRAGPPCVANVFPGTSVVVSPAALKNGLKRGYTEAMSDPTRFNMSSETAMVVKNGDADVKGLPKHPQSLFLPSWAPSKSTSPTPWHVALEQSAGLPLGSNDKPVSALIAPRVEKPAVDCAAAAYKGSQSQPQAPEESAINEAPPSKGQVVGWPPIRSYRKNTLAKPTEMFVKVNMDGVTVGRKVDLNAYNCYEGLLSALEEMFQPSSSAQGASQAALGNDNKQFRLLNGSDFVLTYEDKDGDWMLVGDVPWSMFTDAVRRLRITRAPEATGLGPRKPEKHK